MKKQLKRAKVAAKKTVKQNPLVAVKDANLIVRLPVEQLRAFGKGCEKAGTTMSAEVREFIRLVWP